MSSDPAAPSDLQIQQALRVAVTATERGDYPGAMKVFKAIYGDKTIKAPPDGLSAYGLCVAMEEKQTKKGIELCRAAIAAQFYDSRHYVNLINLHVKKGDRSGALEVFEEAIGRLPQDGALLALRDRLGLRKPPPVAFLSRGNPINRMLSGEKRAPSAPPGGSRFRLAGVHPMVGALIGLLFFAAVFGGTFYFLYHQAYG
jgi:tetratricopeptide (TPR) repeat protein